MERSTLSKDVPIQGLTPIDKVVEILCLLIILIFLSVRTINKEKEFSE